MTHKPSLWAQAKVTNRYDQAKYQLFKICNITLLIAIAIFLAVFFFMLQRMSLIMGGTKTDGITWVAPQAISKYILFIGYGLGEQTINKVAFALMIVFIIIFSALFIGALIPLWFSKDSHKQRWYHLAVIIMFATGFIVGLVYSILLFSDTSCERMIAGLMLVLTILYIPMLVSLILKLRILFLIPSNARLFHAPDSVIKHSNAELVFGKLTPEQLIERSHNQEKIEELKSHDDSALQFINYDHLRTMSIYNRKKILSAKKREALFRAATPWITILIICLPSIIQQLVYSTYSLIDKLLAIDYAPHAYVHVASDMNLIISSLNLATRYGATISNVILSFMVLVTISASILFSYAYGRRSRAEVGQVIGNAITNGIIVSIIVVVIGVFATKYLILFQQGADASTSTLDYKMGYWFVLITFLSFPMQMFSGMMITFLRSEGKAQVTLFILIISCGFNVLFNWLLMSKTNLGLTASAIATLLVYTMNLMLCVFFIRYDRNSWIRLKWSDLRFNKKITANIYLFGLASFFQNLALGFIAILSTYLVSMLPAGPGDVSIDGGQVSNHLVQSYAAISPWIIIFSAPVFGLTQGARNIMSYCYSAKKYERIMQFVKIIFWLQLIIFVICDIFIWSLGTQMLKVFVKDSIPDSVIHRYYVYFSVMSINFLFIPFSYTAITLYQSLGEANKSFFASSLRAWIIVLPMLMFCWALAWCNFDNQGALFYYVLQFVQDFGSALVLIPMLINTWRKYQPELRRGDEITAIDQQIVDFNLQLKTHRTIGRFAKSI